MNTRPCQWMVGLLLMAGAAWAATPVAQVPLKTFGYHSQTVSPSPGAPGAVVANASASDFSVQDTQLSAEDTRYLDEHVTEPTSLLPRGLYTKDLPGGAEVTAFGPFAPAIPTDPHPEQARFTFIGLTW